MRDEAEQLEFVGIERRDGAIVARMRNIDWRGLEWLADRSLLQLRFDHKVWREARGATKAALDAVIAAEEREIDQP